MSVGAQIADGFPSPPESVASRPVSARRFAIFVEEAAGDFVRGFKLEGELVAWGVAGGEVEGFAEVVFIVEYVKGAFSFVLNSRRRQRWSR